MESFEQLLYQLHLSYLQARKHKRNTHNQLKFEMFQEAQLFQLAKIIQDRKYTPKPCIAFIIRKPVMREIFAADFIDRVVHHLIYRCIYPIIDKKLINDTYSCRKGKGTLYGINRAKGFMRSCSQDFTQSTYYLKVDIEAYFMNMQHEIIYDKVVELLPSKKDSFLGISRDTLLYLLRETIFNQVKDNCIIKGSKEDWKDLPFGKSLFNYPNNVGLPIGNLTSQLFGNVYLNNLDHFIKENLKIKYYGRYVDDMVFFHQDSETLQSLIPYLNEMTNEVGLRLHPKKSVLKSINEGVPFLGHIIKPNRNYISNRTKNNFYKAIQEINLKMAVIVQFTWKQLCDMRAIMNSYLGIIRHANSFKLRQSMLNRIDKRFYDFYFVSSNLDKVVINENFCQWHFSQNYQFTN